MRIADFGFGGLLPLRWGQLRFISRQPTITEQRESRRLGVTRFSVPHRAVRHCVHVGCRIVHRRGWSAWLLAGVHVLEVHWSADVTAWWCQGSALNRAGVRVLEVRWRAGSITWLCQRSTLSRAGVRVLEVRWKAGITAWWRQRSTLNRAGVRVLEVRWITGITTYQG